MRTREQLIEENAILRTMLFSSLQDLNTWTPEHAIEYIEKKLEGLSKEKDEKGTLNNKR